MFFGDVAMAGQYNNTWFPSTALWTVIDDAETANWATINTAQSGGWQVIDDEENAGWEIIPTI
jgi:hypothetical protein